MRNEYALFGRKQIILMIVITVILLFGGSSAVVIFGYHVSNVSVVGNIHYSEDEIKDMVLHGNYLDNSILLAIKYRDKSIKDVPFVESMDIEIKDRNSIKINVYEKALAGCVEYLGRYMYFDREGIIVESSMEITQGIPIVTGLSFDEVILYEPLPVEDATIFKEILSITQLLAKYDVLADKIYFEKNGEVILYYDNVRVEIGENKNLDEKIMQLPMMLPNLEGKKGVLHMKDFNSDSETVTFELSD